MKTYGWMCVSTLVEGEVLALRPGRLTSDEGDPGTHFIGGWVGPGVGLNDAEKKNSWLHRDSNSDPSVVPSVASRTFPALIYGGLKLFFLA
jgi:hypothetical protein